MKVLFLTVTRFVDVNARGIYTDLMRKFRDEGHEVYVVSPRERQFGVETNMEVQNGIHVLGVKTLNIQKTNVIEKGLGTILLESQFKRAIKKYLNGVGFDVILYSTPPITFTNVVRYLKRKNNAKTYLLLKDIFPQNAVDLGMFSKQGLLYKYFRNKEKGLYEVSDYIGCMSPANVDFLLKHNAYLNKDNVEVCPNSIEVVNNEKIDKESIKRKYGLPLDRPVFIYGGNLGKPQAIDFLIECMEANKDRNDCFFLVVGNGTEYCKINNWCEEVKPKSMKLLQRLPKEDYDLLVQSCDIGMIFLDHRFTIPNYPSRLLSYLEYKMPILAATDRNTDIGRIAEDNGYGFWCESNDVNAFTELVDKFVSQVDVKQMGEKGYDFLMKNYTVDRSYNVIMNNIDQKNRICYQEKRFI